VEENEILDENEIVDDVDDENIEDGEICDDEDCVDFADNMNNNEVEFEPCEYELIRQKN